MILTLIDQKSPIVLDSTEISWLWTRHKNQDTGINKENSNVINDLDKYQPIEDFDILQNKFNIKAGFNQTIFFTAYKNKLLSKKDYICLNTSNLMGKKCVFRVYFAEKLDFKSNKYAILYSGNIDAINSGFYRSVDTKIGFYKYIPKHNEDFIEFVIEKVDLNEYFIKIWDSPNDNSNILVEKISINF